jgi:hypothetical protein
MTASQLSRPRKQNGLNPTKPPTTNFTCGGRPVLEEPHAEVPIQCSCSSRSLWRTNGVVWGCSLGSIDRCRKVVHHDGVDSERPDESAYGRVTNSSRFGVVVDGATLLIGELVETVPATLTFDAHGRGPLAWRLFRANGSLFGGAARRADGLDHQVIRG